MKKLVSLLFILLMTLSLAAAEESAAGTWYFTLLTVGDYSTTSTNAGLDMTLILHEDGSASSTTVSGLSKKTTEGTWTQQNTALSITLDGEERTGVITDGQIILGNQGSNEKVLTFSHTAPMGVYYTPAAPKAAVTNDYVGTWTCRYAALGTRTLLLSSLDSAAEITVTPLMAQIYIRNTADDETSTTLPVLVRDGALILGSVSAPDYTMQLHEDGIMTCDLGTGVVYYFERSDD